MAMVDTATEPERIGDGGRGNSWLLESWIAGDDAEPRLGKYRGSEPILRDQHGRHRRLLKRSKSAIEPGIRKIRRLPERVK